MKGVIFYGWMCYNYYSEDDKVQKFRKIYIEITNVCNLKCSFCPETKREKEFMSLSSFEDILKKISGYTSLITLHVKGEPLLHPNLKEFVELASKYNLVIDLTTNGTLLNKLDASFLKLPALRQINISLHSFSNKEVGMELINEFLKIERKSDLIISIREWDSALDTYIKGYEKEKNVFFNKGSRFEWPSVSGQVLSETGTCLGGKTHIAILVDGTVVPCCLDNDGDLALGNIFELELSDILSCDRYVSMIEGFKQNKLVEDMCKKCSYCKRFSK